MLLTYADLCFHLHLQPKTPVSPAAREGEGESGSGGPAGGGSVTRFEGGGGEAVKRGEGGNSRDPLDDKYINKEEKYMDRGEWGGAKERGVGGGESRSRSGGRGETGAGGGSRSGGERERNGRAGRLGERFPRGASYL